MNDRYQHAVDEIRAVCKKHGVFLVGTCMSEGIYGEILVGDSNDPEASGWLNVEDRLRNTVEIEPSGSGGFFCVHGIGEIDTCMALENR